MNCPNEKRFFKTHLFLCPTDRHLILKDLSNFPNFQKVKIYEAFFYVDRENSKGEFELFTKQTLQVYINEFITSYM